MEKPLSGSDFPERGLCFWRFLALFFHPIRDGIHDGQDEQGEDGRDDETACDGDRHRPPEDAAHEGEHAEDGGGCGEHDGAEAQDCGVDDGVHGLFARLLVLFDLVDEDDGVADDHAEEGEHAEVGDEAHGRVREEHGERDADKPHRGGEEGERHLAHGSDLQHEEGHDDEDHGGHGLHEVAHRLGGVLKRAGGGDACAGGKVCAQLLCRCVDPLRRVVALAGRGVALHDDGRAQVAPLDEAVLGCIGEVCDLGEGDGSALRCDRQFAEALEVRAVCVCEAQRDADRAVARIELRGL